MRSLFLFSPRAVVYLDMELGNIFAPGSLLNRTREGRMGRCDFKSLLLVRPQGQSPRLGFSVQCRLRDVHTAATSKGGGNGVREAGQFS